MRIVVIHQYFLRPGESGGSRFNEFTRHWRESGHDIFVVAGQVHYATGERPHEYHGRWIVKDDYDGVKVLRCYTPGTYHNGIIGRLWAFFGFLLSSVWVMMFAVSKPDVIIASSPPLTAAIPGMVGKRIHRVPLVFEVRDLWPESAVATGVLREKGWFTRLLYRLEKRAYREADRINVLTPAFREDIVGRGLAPSGKILFVPNGADLGAFSQGPRDNEVRKRYGWGDMLVALYAGAHGKANCLSQLVDTAVLLRGEGILIATVGEGPEKADLEVEAARRGLENILFLGSVSKEEMPEYIRAADVGLAVLKRTDTFKTVYPNKVFDYMACGRPTLVAIDGIARRMVTDEAEAGLYAEPENAEEIASQLRKLKGDAALRERFGANGRSFVEKHFAREVLAKKYEEALSELTTGGRGAPATRGAHPLKRLLDIAASCAGLIFLSPLMACLALAVRGTMGSPVLFRQERPGMGARLFRLYKFRTMRNEPGGGVSPASDAGRITPLGRWMRKWSLDELPELYNVLKGDMSLVGPRPLLPQYLSRYTEVQARRHEVRPGLTGWAQVHGRNEISWEEKFALDVWYVDNRSFPLDVRILLLTVGRVLGKKGISAEGEATMPEFMGTDPSGEKRKNA